MAEEVAEEAEEKTQFLQNFCSKSLDFPIYFCIFVSFFAREAQY
jgi:hypothetical protein